jgi:putative peptidoglycan lipid II flippase
MVEENKKLVRATGVIGAATFLSRILGFARDMIIAGLFGASLSADAFFVAFRVPNLLRKLFGEGALSAAFVPVFTETLAQDGKKRAWELASTTITILVFVLAIITACGIIFAPQIVRVLAPGFFDSQWKVDLTTLLTRVMFPFIFFIGLMSVCMGILNSLKHFAAPALAPALLNISIIISALALTSRLEIPVMALAYGVLAGGFLQLIFHVPFLKQKGMVFRPRFNLQDPKIKRIGKLMIPVIIGSAVTEINIVIDTLLASFLPEGSVSYLYYGNRLIQFPLGVFGIALGTAILPTLSLQATEGRIEELKDTFSFGMRFILFITVPALVGLALLRIPIMNLLFQRGEFTAMATIGSAQAVLYYSLGLCAYAGVKITAPVFYAFQDTKTPVRMAIIAMVCNVFLNLILMIPLKHAGLALATSLSAMINLCGLVYYLRKKLGRIQGRRILNSFLKVSFVSSIMGLITYKIIDQIDFLTDPRIFTRLLVLSEAVFGGVVVYFLISYLMHSEELHFLKKAFSKKKTAVPNNS